MIVCQNARELYFQVHAGEIPENVFNDVADMLCHDPYLICPFDPETNWEASVLWLKDSSLFDRNFMNYLGGYVFFCQTIEDLKKVEGADFKFFDKHNRWPNMLDQSLYADICEKLPGTPGVISYCLITSNTGGSVYYIPEKLWTENVLNSLSE